VCAICGIVQLDPARGVAPELIVRMRDAMVHRGPDDAGVHVEANVGLGHRRLSILDLSERGRQPMFTPDGRYAIVHNGEVYNFRELRRPLELAGVRFRSDTDTEVLLHLFAAEGPAMLHRLNGMFAFAVWDAAERRLFIARDRVGVKPLYWSLHDGSLRFASEPKALFASGQRPAFDHGSWEELLCFRYVAGDRTPYQGVNRLLPGHYLTTRGGPPEIHRWWNLAERVLAQGAAESDSPETYRALLDDAVALCRISDVSVGVLLSGGLDSSAIAASMAHQAGGGVASFTVRFDEPLYDEGAFSRQVADRHGLARHELVVAPERYFEGLEEAARLNDEPLAHGQDLHLLAVSRLAKPRVTVLLSGEGADETMAGYVRYRPLRFPRLLDALRPLAPLARFARGQRRIRKLGEFLGLGGVDAFVFYNSCDALPAHLPLLGLEPTGQHGYRRGVLEEARRFSSDAVSQVMYYDTHTFLCSLLDRNDRMTMGASIECRVPFLDHRLVERAFARPSASYFGQGQGKWLLRRAMQPRLPASVLAHKKWGFGVPWPKLLRAVPALRERVAAIPGSALIRESPLDPVRVGRVMNDFLAGDDSLSFLAIELLMIAMWHDACVRP
jgi:asparagine synthase (glutamine-hydrolysing)